MAKWGYTHSSHIYSDLLAGRGHPTPWLNGKWPLFTARRREQPGHNKHPCQLLQWYRWREFRLHLTNLVWMMAGYFQPVIRLKQYLNNCTQLWPFSISPCTVRLRSVFRGPVPWTWLRGCFDYSILYFVQSYCQWCLLKESCPNMLDNAQQNALIEFFFWKSDTQLL